MHLKSPRLFILFHAALGLTGSRDYKAENRAEEIPCPVMFLIAPKSF